MAPPRAPPTHPAKTPQEEHANKSHPNDPPGRGKLQDADVVTPIPSRLYCTFNPTGEAMQDVGWYYAVNGQRQGPVPFDQLRQMTTAGQVAHADLVWHEGMADWQPAGSIPALAPPPQLQPIYPTPPPQYQGYAPVQVGYNTPEFAGRSHQGMAIAGFVLSLVFFFPVCTILGLIFSLVALNGMKTTSNQSGRGLAVAGTVISMIVGGLWVLYFVGIAACLTHF
jgi:hypothetical protein